MKRKIAVIYVVAVQDARDPAAIYLRNDSGRKNTVTVTALDNGRQLSRQLTLNRKTLRLAVRRGKLVVENTKTIKP